MWGFLLPRSLYLDRHRPSKVNDGMLTFTKLLDFVSYNVVQILKGKSL